MNSQDQELRDLLVAALDAELGPRLDPADRSPGEPTAGPRRRLWLPPAAAAAAVLLLAGIIVAVVRTSTDHAVPPGAPHGVRVTCVPTSSRSATDDDRALRARMEKLAEHGGMFMGDRMVTITVPGADRKAVSGLCASHSLEFRPLVAPTVLGSTSSGTSVSMSGLPKSDDAYDRLTATQKSDVTAMLRSAPCTPTSSTSVDGPTVACVVEQAAGGRLVALLGPAVVTQSDVVAATVVPPSTEGGVLDWTVAVTLDEVAAHNWATYTARHHSSVATGASSRNCATSTTPCADFVAVVYDGQVISLPQTVAAIAGGMTQISGGFDEKSARSLAAALSAAPLPVPLRLVNIENY